MLLDLSFFSLCLYLVACCLVEGRFGLVGILNFFYYCYYKLFCPIINICARCLYLHVGWIANLEILSVFQSLLELAVYSSLTIFNIYFYFMEGLNIFP